MHDLPEVHLLVREHQVEEVCCEAVSAAESGKPYDGNGGPSALWATSACLSHHLHEY